jgi:molybdopterin/thiamine biosynthesis adenylyltransferase/rhodanese-related sulfurtransferase
MADRTSPLERTPAETAQGQSATVPLLDIRDANERQVGMAEGAVVCPAEDVLARAQSEVGDRLTGGYIMCAGGVRSRNLVETLHQMGLTGFYSITGGFRAWREAGLPANYPAGLGAPESERYARHLVMPQVGPEGQKKLLHSRMLLVGLGGLNSPVALYLAAAGVGTLGLVDDDRVERSNLQRQIIHTDASIGELKIQSARKRIEALNPSIAVETFDIRVDQTNATDCVHGWDLVIDGSDNFPSRYALNRACLHAGLPLVYGAVMRFQGQVAVFWPSGVEPAGPCYRCLFHEAPAEADAPNCAVAGVLGVLPGLVGTLQACEAIKLVLGIGQPLVGRLLMIDALSMEFRETRLRRDPACPDCSNGSHGIPD